MFAFQTVSSEVKLWLGIPALTLPSCVILCLSSHICKQEAVPASEGCLGDGFHRHG